MIAGLALAAVLVPAAATSQVSDDGPSAKTLGRLLSRILDCETVRLRAEGRGVCDAGLEGPARTFIEDSGALAFGALLDADPRPDLSGLPAQQGCQREIGRSVARIAKAALVGLDRSGSIRGAPGRSVVDALAAACEAPVAGLAAGLTLPMVGDQCAAAIGPPGESVDAIALAHCFETLLPVWADRADGDAEPLRPNIVLIVTDDQRWDTLDDAHTRDGMPAMAAVMDRLAGSGVRFGQSFVTTPVCTPSRGSLLTGQLAHRSGLKRNILALNEPAALADHSTLATWLHDAGYRTGHYGKYMNFYHSLRLQKGGLYVPPGWDDWRVFDANSGGRYQSYTMVENDRLVAYDEAEANYSTDVIADQALRFIDEAIASGDPFFVLWSPEAPHYPMIPAARHEGLFLPFGVLSPLDTPSYFEEDVSDKPAWIRALTPYSELAALAVEVIRIRQLQMLQSVDEFVDDLMDRLEASGVAGDTIVVFTSDNGFTWAEHRWVGKACTYEACLRVPLVVRYPRLAPLPRADDALALNIDLAPTLAELAGAEPPIDRDGRSLVRTLDGTERDPPETFHFESFAGTRFSFVGIREARWKFSEYAITGERELYDLLEDPYELENLASDPDQAARVQAFRERILERRPGWPNDLD